MKKTVIILSLIILSLVAGTFYSNAQDSSTRDSVSQVTVQTNGQDNKPVTGVSLNKRILELDINKTERLHETVTPSDATNKRVIWSSNDAKIATVDANGSVTANSVGNAKITVTTTDGNNQAICAVTVIKQVKSITLQETSIDIKVGEEMQLSVSCDPVDTTEELEWKSNKPGIATINNGKVSAIFEGEATITVSTKGGSKKTDSCIVKVTQIIPVESLKLNKSLFKLNVNDTLRLEAIVEPSDATDQKVIWNSEIPGIASVDSTGLVIAISKGKTIITGRTDEGDKIDSCTIEVIDSNWFKKIQNTFLVTNGIYLYIISVLFAALIVVCVLFFILRRQQKNYLALKEKQIAEIDAMAKIEHQAKKNLDTQYKQLTEKYNELRKQVDFLQNKANFPKEQSPQPVPVPISVPQPTPQRRKLYADFISDYELINVKDTLDDFPIFELELIDSSTAKFKICESSKALVIERPSYLAGCEKNIVPDGKTLIQTSGTAHETGGKWVVTEPLKVKIV